MLRQIAPTIWTVPQALTALGLAIGTRMTIVKLSDGSLWLHSPVKFTPELLAEVQALGPIRYLVAPNCFHHLFFGAWAEANPEAKKYAPRGLAKKRSDLTFDAELSRDIAADWNGEIQLKPVLGAPLVNEWVFFHEASSTLLVTDSFFYLENATGMLGLYARLNGVLDGPSQSLLFKFAIKDKPAFVQSMREIMRWEFEKMTLPHHSIIEFGAHERALRGLAWCGIA